MATGLMRAAIVSRFGAARDVFTIVDNRKMPEPRSGEVLVKVTAASINPIEVRRRSGYARTMMKRQGAVGFPMILGLDYAGVVAKAGGGFKKGDKVYGVKPHSTTGSNAEYCAVPAKFTLSAPPNVELNQLASFPYAFLTVWSALVDGAGLVPRKAQGKRVFIQGGAGGTGTLAIQLCKAWGATVIQYGSNPNDALQRAKEHGDAEGMVYIHPFDSERTVEGTATLGVELLEDLPDLDCVLIAIGGGGLIAGMAAAIKQLRPDVAIFGVEPIGAPSMHVALQAGHVVDLPEITTIADTLAPRHVCELTRSLTAAYVDDVVLVDDHAIMRAARWLWRECNQLVEPAGAASIAAFQSGAVDLGRYRHPVALICGGNAAADGVFEAYEGRIKG